MLGSLWGKNQLIPRGGWGRMVDHCLKPRHVPAVFQES